MKTEIDDTKIDKNFDSAFFFELLKKISLDIVGINAKHIIGNIKKKSKEFQLNLK